MMTRKAGIEAVLTNEIREAGAEVTVWEADGWAEFVLPPRSDHAQGHDALLRMPKMLGLLPAERLPDGRVEVSFCPAFLARHTAGMTDQIHDDFMDVLGFLARFSVEHVDLPIDERQHAAEDALAAAVPVGLELLTFVQLTIVHDMA